MRGNKGLKTGKPDALSVKEEEEEIKVGKEGGRPLA
jgi:hypothetical protein